MEEASLQCDYPLSFGWGLAAADRSQSDVAVVVDVLSFSTTVSIAVDRGMKVYPYGWADESAKEFARQHDAVLAVGRFEASRSGAAVPSLSPSALLESAPIARLVLPSPNGSSICERLRARRADVAIGCLRNASATARHVRRALDLGQTVTVIAAGERWPEDDTLRPCLEDHLGAGAVIANLVSAGYSDRMSPEARAAGLLFAAHAHTLAQTIRDCPSGKELRDRGFGSDVAVATQTDVSQGVPILVDGAFAIGASAPYSDSAEQGVGHFTE